MSSAPGQFKMRCIFCGGTPCTREHYWPQWCHDEDVFDELGPEINPGDDQYGLTDNGEWVFERKARKSGRRRIDDTAFRVCDPCNGGWMSGLQNAVIPTLRPLVRGDAAVTTLEEFPKLAAWATMTTMVIDALHRSAIPEADRHAFKVSLAAPPSWCVWVGQADDRKWNALYKMRPWRQAASKGTAGFTMNFCLGRAAFVITNEVALSPATQHNMWVEGMRVIHPSPAKQNIDWRRLDRLMFVTLEQMDKALEAAAFEAVRALHKGNENTESPDEALDRFPKSD